MKELIESNYNKKQVEARFSMKKVIKDPVQVPVPQNRERQILFKNYLL